MHSRRSSSQIPTVKAGKRPPRALARGNQAAQTIFSKAKDQVVKSVRNRYLGNKGISNLARDVSTLMSVVNTEDKHIDVLPSLQTVTSTVPLVYQIGGVSQGTTNTTRIGDSILINRIDLSLTFQFGTGTLATTAVQSQTFRVWLVRYLKTPITNGFVPFGINEFLNTDFASNYSVNSFPNTDTNENFQIMADDTIEVTLPQFTTAASYRAVNKLYTKDCHFHQSYNGSSSSNVCDNCLFLVFVALNPTNAGGPSGVYPASRVWYVDN